MAGGRSTRNTPAPRYVLRAGLGDPLWPEWEPQRLSGGPRHPSAMQANFETSQIALQSGERQLWAGVPRQGLVLRPSDAIQIPFSCLWAGFAVFWELKVMRTGAPFFFRLWGLPFIAMGVYITVGRFFIDAMRRARTAYAVTSDRIIITRAGRFAQTQSLMLATLPDVTLTEGKDGSGTITFGLTGALPLMARGATWSGAPRGPSFESIPDAQQVYGIIQRAQQAARSRTQ